MNSRTSHIHDYSEVPDPALAAMLTAEDAAEEDGLSPFERTTCRTHRRWVHQCISSPAHVVVVTGHRWCRGCRAVASVAIDELSGSVTVVCQRCKQPPRGLGTRQITNSCRASIARSRQSAHTTSVTE